MLVWDDIIYLPNDHYCYIPHTHLRTIFWLFVNLYGNPLLLLSLIYIRIAVHLRRQPHNQLRSVKQRQKRDLIIIRRLFIIIGTLLALGIPAIVLLVMLFITGEQHPLLFRIEWLTVSLSMIVLDVLLVLFTPQLKTIVWKLFLHDKHRVRPTDGNVTSSTQKRCNIAII